jgi:leader peptidase (prepilin peptidase)/N-methyltransferase
LSYGGLAVFAVSMAFVPSGRASGMSGLLVGMLVMTAITALLVVASGGSLGMGDLHISPLLGALVGWFAPSAILVAWIAIAVAGALVTSVGLLTRRISRESMIPYGPFMMIGSLASVVWVAVR